MLKELSEIKRYQYIINIDIKATDIERAELAQSLSEAMQTGAIDVLDRIDIEEIENLRLAKQVIKLRQKAKQERADRDAKLVHERKLDELKASGEIDLQKSQFEQEMALKRIMAEGEIKAKLLAFEGEASMRKVSLEGQWGLAIAREKAGAQRGIDDNKEDRKDKRVALQSEQQSELIDQRQNQTGPKTFEKKTTRDDASILPTGYEGLAPNIE